MTFGYEAYGGDFGGYGAEVEAYGEEPAGLGEVLRAVLREDLSDASPQQLDDALSDVLGAMNPAESFSFTKALQQIEKGARQALADPTVSSVLRTALPLAAGAAGTMLGGPLGTAVGSSLGTALVNALPGAPAPPRPPAAPAPTPPPSPGSPAAALAGGSAAAAQGLVLTQQPDVLKALLALALGQAGRPSVNGVPVPQIMNMLSDVFGRAAAHADELVYVHPEAYVDAEASEEIGGAGPHSLYVALMDADAYELAEAAAASSP